MRDSRSLALFFNRPGRPLTRSVCVHYCRIGQPHRRCRRTAGDRTLPERVLAPAETLPSRLSPAILHCHEVLPSLFCDLRSRTWPAGLNFAIYMDEIRARSTRRNVDATGLREGVTAVTPDGLAAVTAKRPGTVISSLVLPCTALVVMTYSRLAEDPNRTGSVTNSRWTGSSARNSSSCCFASCWRASPSLSKVVSTWSASSQVEAARAATP